MGEVVAFVFAICSPALTVRAETVEAVLARMDRAAVSFRDMTAQFKKSTFTAVLNDTSEESGAVWLKRSRRSVAMRTEIGQPEPRSIGLEDNNGEIYYPKINTVQIYDLGKERGLVDQFLLLGFGSSGKELARSYTVKVAGEEVVEGRETARLELFPKSAKVLEQIKKVELWIPLDAGYPVRQRILQPGGDFYLISYSDIKINPNLSDNEFRLKLPPGVKKDYPQK